MALLPWIFPFLIYLNPRYCAQIVRRLFSRLAFFDAEIGSHISSYQFI